jgi:biopolymer transport protein ExbB
MGTFIERFHSGGPFMYFILGVGIFSMFLLTERTFVLFFRAKKAPEAFRMQLRTFIRNGDIKGAMEFAKAEDNKLLSPIVATACALRVAGAGDDEIQSRMDEALTEQISTIDRGTSFLAVVGNVATLIGLLGTISGMITSFASVNGANAADRASKLSLGISEAMNCTAFGLLVAIPALLGYALFQNKTERTINWLTETVTKVYNDLIYSYDQKPQN